MPRKTGEAGGAAAHGRTPASMRPRPDAAENSEVHRELHMEWAGFNEAAARCRGKRPRGRRRRDGRAVASMRPRPDAAENGRIEEVTPPKLAGFNEAAARCRGKRAGE